MTPESPAPGDASEDSGAVPDAEVAAADVLPAENPRAHPWRRFVAIGDSFTEGIGDPSPESPGGHRGWADRVAEVLADAVPDFAYANLAVRGKLIAQIVADQVEPALALQPDLITICAGGNDVIRPGTDPDEISAQFEDAIIRLVGAILLEQNDEWAVQRARYSTLESVAQLSDDPLVTLPAMAA
jgi:lysophospholipase L1-like esterase